MEEKLEMGKNSTKNLIMFNQLFKPKKTMIGMIHLPALPGYPKHTGMDDVIQKALSDLNTLQKAGFDGILVENDNDQPHQIGVSKTISNAFTKVMEQICRNATIPVGMEIIYDMLETIRVAHKVRADFVRLDVFVDSVETEWGKITAQPKEIVELKKKLGADNLVLLTDIQVKHAKMLQEKTIAASTQEAIENGSDALIVTGDWTGHAPSISDCKSINNFASNFPLLIGSGFNIYNSKALLQYADGAIVGTSIKTGEYVDFTKAKKLINSVRNLKRNDNRFNIR
ncbi:MAG: BtpA/SgcQ family protein [Candidatus Levybacteria bacterium]|nr:BtpA/SgcQ family protein [Candidatus Levybacteria bacterium]